MNCLKLYIQTVIPLRFSPPCYMQEHNHCYHTKADTLLPFYMVYSGTHSHQIPEVKQLQSIYHLLQLRTKVSSISHYYQLTFHALVPHNSQVSLH